MSDFSINVTGTKNISQNLDSTKNKLRTMANDSALGRNDTHVQGLLATLENARRNIENASDEVSSLKTALDQIVSRYSNAEKTIESNNSKNGNNAFGDVLMGDGKMVGLALADMAKTSGEKDEEIAFKNNMMEQFGMDEETSELMVKVYRALEREYPNATNLELAWRFSRLLGGLSYDSGGMLSTMEWNQTCGNALTRYNYETGINDLFSEELYFTHVLGLTQAEYGALKEKVISQHANVSTDASPEQGDFAHQMITTSAILAKDLEKDGALPNFFGDIASGGGINYWSNERVAEEAGWRGDATLGSVQFRNDDYIADLDAVNITTYLERGEDISILGASNNYYTDLSTGERGTRADIFLETKPLEEVKEAVYGDLVYRDLDTRIMNAEHDGNTAVAQELQSYRENEDYAEGKVKEYYGGDAYDFLISLENGSSTMVEAEKT